MLLAPWVSLYVIIIGIVKVRRESFIRAHACLILTTISMRGPKGHSYTIYTEWEVIAYHVILKDIKTSCKGLRHGRYLGRQRRGIFSEKKRWYRYTVASIWSSGLPNLRHPTFDVPDLCDKILPCDRQKHAVQSIKMIQGLLHESRGICVCVWQLVA